MKQIIMRVPVEVTSLGGEVTFMTNFEISFDLETDGLTSAKFKLD